MMRGIRQRCENDEIFAFYRYTPLLAAVTGTYSLNKDCEGKISDHTSYTRLGIKDVPGRADTVKILLEWNADTLTVGTGLRLTALEIAIFFGDIPTTRVLLNHWELKYPTLHMAFNFESGVFPDAMVEELLTNGVDIDEFSEDTGVLDRIVVEKTPLLYAAEHRQPLFVQRLLELGADRDATDFHNRTALHCACQGLMKANRLDTKQALAVIRTLLDERVHIEAVDTLGRTALVLAIQTAEGPAAEEVIEPLPDRGAQVLGHNWNSMKTLTKYSKKGYSMSGRVAMLMRKGGQEEEEEETAGGLVGEALCAPVGRCCCCYKN